MQEEKINNPISGYTMLLVMLVLIALTILTFVTLKAPIAIGLIMSNKPSKFDRLKKKC